MKKLLLLAIGACLFASCAKNLDEDGPIDASKQKMLMDKAWQLRAYTLNPNINDTNSFARDQYSTMQDCEKDDYYVFEDEHTLTWYDHYIKCSLASPSSRTYEYALSNNEKHLTAWSNPDDPEHSIAIDGNMTYPSIDSFILTWQVDYGNDTVAEYIQTFVKITPN